MDENSLENPIMFHIGLMGHIDSGKTYVARRLTEIISTAGLDKHSQAQKRGITIDMGFTFFSLDNYIITIVDAPGHAELIKSVISAANIIDIAFLVIDAKKGMQVQTGEHLVILDLLKIPFIFILINKIDLVSDDELTILEKKIEKIMNNTRFKGKFKIFRVSAKEDIGFNEVKSALSKYISENPPKRNIDGEFIYLIDHAFKKKGIGMVFTGTVISGKASIGDRLILLPQNVNCKIKSLQRAKMDTQTIKAGDRCGMAVMKVPDIDVYRGTFAVRDISGFKESQFIEVHVKQTPLFRQKCSFGQQLTINYRMDSLNGRLFPFEYVNYENRRIMKIKKPEIGELEFDALLWLEKPYYMKEGDVLLLSRLDLSPKNLRIMGTADVIRILDSAPVMYRQKTKVGKVINKDFGPDSVIVEGLVKSKEGSKAIRSSHLEAPFGRVLDSFGQKGKVIVSIRKEYVEKKNDLISNGMDVILKFYKPIVLDYSKSYRGF